MRCLGDLSSEANFATPSASRDSIRYAQKFTRRFRECEHLPAPAREAAMLPMQFQQAFQPPQPGDLFVGRIVYPVASFGPEPAGLGWCFDFCGAKRWAASPEADAKDRSAVDELITFWENRVTELKTRHAYPADVAEVLPTDCWTEESGVAFPLYRMAGTVLDYAKLLREGWNVASEGDDDFSRSCRTALEAFRKTIRRYAEMSGVDHDVRRVLVDLLERGPVSFREAVQFFWLWALHAGTWNYGRLDVALGPFLARDLDAGVLSEESATGLLCSLWRLMHAYANQYNNRVIIGGRGRPDEASADRFALLAIEATRRVRLNQPQLSLRFYEGQSPALWDAAISAIGEGCTFPMLYNDDVNIPAVAAAFGVSDELAADYTPFGCGEYVLGHRSVGTPSGVINLPKALEIALHGGMDSKTGRRVLDLPSVSDIKSFGDLWASYTAVLERHISALAVQEKIEYEVSGREASFLFISLLTDDCVGHRCGVFSGGVRHLGGTLETYGNSNVADSLHAIEELVFRRREIALPDLAEALDANFAGSGDLRRRCLGIAKYGNDEATADAMARRVHDHVCMFTRDQAAKVGLDSYQVVVINNWANVVLGRCVGASAEGRLAGEPFANGNNPTPGSDTSGVTAFLNSIASLDPSIHAGAVQNMKFTKEWFQPANRPKFEALLRGYFARGGTQAMITVVSRADLESAMIEPGKWGHLLVRVGGFSIRFVDLPREAQLEVLGRTLH